MQKFFNIKSITITILATMLSLFSVAANSSELLSKDWDDIVKQAKEEGKVVWYQWYFQPEFRKITKEFEKEYGIKVSIPEVASYDSMQQKLLAESRRETGDIDVFSLGGDKFNSLDLGKVFFGPIFEKLPEKNALRTNINGGKGMNYAVAFWGNQSGMAYNSDLIKSSDLPTALTLDRWISDNPGGLGFNFTNGGSGPSFIQNMTRQISGRELGPSDTGDAVDLNQVWDWFNGHRDNYIFTNGNADSLIRINDGEFLIVPAWEDHLAGLQKKNVVGQHIKFYIPNWGMNGGGNAVAIPANAENKAAAIVFIHWLTSAQTQTKFNTDFGSAPVNANADDSSALVPNWQRVNQRDWMNDGFFKKKLLNGFMENVVQK